MLGKYTKHWPRFEELQRRKKEGAPVIGPLRVRVADTHHVAGHKELRIVSEVGGAKIERIVEVDNPDRFTPGQELDFTWKGAKVGKGARVVSVGTLVPVEKRRNEERKDSSTSEGGGPERSGEGKKKREKNEGGPKPLGDNDEEAPGSPDMTPEEMAELNIVGEVSHGKLSFTIPGGKAERRAEGRTVGKGVLVKGGPDEKLGIIGEDGAHHVLVAHGALPGDEVEYAEARGERKAEVLKVTKRFPHRLVGTLSVEDTQKPGTMLLSRSVVFFPDPLDLPPNLKNPVTLPEDFADVVSGLSSKVVFRRAEDPAEDEWVFESAIGPAEHLDAEIRALAERTPNGAKRIEDLTDEDIRRYAESVDPREFPELRRELEGLTAEAVRAQIAELEAMERGIADGSLTTEDLVARLLAAPSVTENPLSDIDRAIAAHQAAADPDALREGFARAEEFLARQEKTREPGFKGIWGDGWTWDEAPSEGELLPSTLERYRHGENRIDFRKVPTFAIDPKTAKDHDDALSYRVLDDGRIEVGVHIADPTAFIPSGSPLDILARFRQKTQYLRQVTLPLFPDIISSRLCSLKKGEDRMAFSTVFTFPPRGSWPSDELPAPEVWYGRTVVRSDEQYSYDDAEEALVRGEGPHAEALSFLKSTGEAFRAARVRAGYTEVGSDEETEFLFENGALARAVNKPRLASMRLVEDWMIRANEAFVDALDLALLRVHEAPEYDKLVDALGQLGFTDLVPKSKDEYDPVNIVREARRRIQAEESATIRRSKSKTLVRALPRAKYLMSGTDVGHFGVALSRYGHYTSPIRRYPDIALHRLMDAKLAGNPVTKEGAAYAYFEEATGMANEREPELDKNERDANEMLALKLLSDSQKTNRRVTARVVSKSRDRRNREQMNIEVVLPGGGAFQFRLFRQDVLATSIQRGARALRPEEWNEIRPGTTHEFLVETADVSRRKLVLSLDSEPLEIAREEGRFARLPDGATLGLSIESEEGEGSAIIVSLYDGNTNTRVARSYRIARENLSSSNGEPVRDGEWAVLRPSLERKNPKVTVALRRRNGTPSFELRKVIVPERVNPFIAFSKKYEGQKVTAVVQEASAKEIVVNFETRPAIQSYRIPRSYFKAVPDAVWNTTKPGYRMIFLVNRVDSEKRLISLNWIDARPPRQKGGKGDAPRRKKRGGEDEGRRRPRGPRRDREKPE